MHACMLRIECFVCTIECVFARSLT